MALLLISQSEVALVKPSNIKQHNYFVVCAVSECIARRYSFYVHFYDRVRICILELV